MSAHSNCIFLESREGKAGRIKQGGNNREDIAGHREEE